MLSNDEVSAIRMQGTASPSDVNALCETVLALREQLMEEQGHGQLQAESVMQLETENSALREQLAAAQSLSESTLDHNRSLKDQLAQVTQERDTARESVTRLTVEKQKVEQDQERLLRGEFTPEEFQNLCHNTDIQKGFDAFADGCEAYQQKMFGRCRTKGKVL